MFAGYPRRYFLSRALTDDLGTAIVKNLRLVAQIRGARGALEVERFRLATGRLPDNLAELSPTFVNGIALDPFDGQPLRYKKLAKGYVVYSVGEDGKDDGGMRRRTSPSRSSDELAGRGWMSVRPPIRRRSAGFGATGWRSLVCKTETTRVAKEMCHSTKRTHRFLKEFFMEVAVGTLVIQET